MSSSADRASFPPTVSFSVWFAQNLKSEDIHFVEVRIVYAIEV
jgi:hypothetical protein